jgi:hypothetical protein
MKYMLQKNRFLRHLPTYPLIFLAVFPIMILDLWVEMYHRFCFPFYRIPYVRRKEYIKIDRHKLKYLNLMQKYNCAYCGYVNGVAAYWVKIFAETESYWCGIRHETSDRFNAPEHHEEFIAYNDRKGYDEEFYSKKTPGL